MYSRTSQVKTVLDLPNFPLKTVVLGEFMFGSQWAQHRDRAGKIFIFDCVCFYGKDVRDEPYRERLLMARQIVEETGFPLVLVKNYPISMFARVWDALQTARDFEGLVFRNWSHPYDTAVGRIKLDVNDDFVIMDVVEGKGKHAGKMGALVVGKYVNGELTSVMSVGGGFSDDARDYFWLRRNTCKGWVVEVTGKARFESGALRHPNFVKIRTDKTARECTAEPTNAD